MFISSPGKSDGTTSAQLSTTALGDCATAGFEVSLTFAHAPHHISYWIIRETSVSLRSPDLSGRLTRVGRAISSSPSFLMYCLLSAEESFGWLEDSVGAMHSVKSFHNTLIMSNNV